MNPPGPPISMLTSHKLLRLVFGRFFCHGLHSHRTCTGNIEIGGPGVHH